MVDIKKHLRDHHAHKVGPVECGTLDLLADIMDAVGQGKSTVLSAFRTPEFFFKAEDGIRDADVTGVQTCALPISSQRSVPPGTLWNRPLGGPGNHPKV